MKNLRFLFLLTVFFSAIFFTGCNKDDDNSPEPQPEQNTTEYKAKTVKIPDAMAQSDDYGAQMTTAYLDMMNGMADYGDMLTPPGKSTKIHFKDGGTDTYTWDVNEDQDHYTITLKVREENDKTYWEMYINGTFDGLQLNNFLFIQAEEENDGSASTFVVYDPETGNKYMSIDWSTGNDGSVDMTFEVFEEMVLNAHVNADGSGSVEMKQWYMNVYITAFKAQWDATGHGQWWQYSNGAEIDSGSW
jgi:hypothetical protein